MWFLPCQMSMAAAAAATTAAADSTQVSAALLVRASPRADDIPAGSIRQRASTAPAMPDILFTTAVLSSRAQALQCHYDQPV
jgi:hypothetical protein